MDDAKSESWPLPRLTLVPVADGNSSDPLAGENSSWDTIRPLDVLRSFSSLRYMWNTSHICHNRSIEFKQMSEERGQSCTAADRCILFSDASPKFAVLNVCVCVCVSTLSYSTGSVHTPTTFFFFPSFLEKDKVAFSLTVWPASSRLFSFQLITVFFLTIDEPTFDQLFYLFLHRLLITHSPPPSLKFQSPYTLSGGLPAAGCD